jgi:hypothetical protein
LDWTLHWILIVISLHCGNGTNETDLAKIDPFQEEMKTNNEMLAKMEAKTDATLNEMKEELRQGWKPRSKVR